MTTGLPDLMALVGGTLLTGVLKWHSNKATHTARIEELRLLGEKQRVTAFQKAREAEVSGWMSFGRTIMILGAMAAHLFPIVAPAFWDVTVTYFYFETNQGFWPWEVPFDQMHSLTIGSGNNPIVITPTNQMILNGITGCIFGTASQQR